MHPPPRIVAALLLSLATACSDRPAPARHIAFPPSDQKPQPPEPKQLVVPTEGHCLPVWPTPVLLTGIVEQEHHLGPPGYGESPQIDEKLTIYVLRLARPFAVCADADPADPRPQVDSVTLMQLTGKVDPDRLKEWIGETVSVFGALHDQTLSHDFTSVIIDVDSIPMLRSTSVGRRAA